MRLMVATLVLALSGCLSVGRPMIAMLEKLTGTPHGWFEISPLLTLDRDGALVLPPATSLDEEDDAPYMERVLATHRRQFHELDASAPCIAHAGPAPVYVLIHGIGGVGNEWVPVIPTLAQTKPAGLYMYRWFAYEQRGELVKQLAAGIERAARCFPESRIVVLGHSAGGVLAALAASRIDVGVRSEPVELITVASPLAGVGAIPEVDPSNDAVQFLNDLGAVRHAYPAAAPGITVLHLRTSYPADKVMKPTRGGYSPNAISAVVKGSRVVDLPDTLSHADSLLYVARQLARGRLLGDETSGAGPDISGR